MNEQFESLRKEVAEYQVGLGSRYPKALRVRVVEATRELRSRGWSWARLSEFFGITKTSLRAWYRVSKTLKQPALLPVSVKGVSRQPPKLTLVSPLGHRLEGLDAETALFMMRGLSC